MSYELLKPYTDKQYADFVCLHQGLTSYENETAFYFLEVNEIVQDGEIVINPNYEQEQEQKEQERIAQLHLTRGDVFRALLQARQVTRANLRAMIEGNPILTELQKEMALIDFDESLEFYRGNALINTVGLALEITPQQLDEFFQTNDYTKLLPIVEPEPIEETVTEDV